MQELKSTSFLYGSNAVFIEELYERYIADPNSVDEEWRNFFKNLADNPSNVENAARGAAWSPYQNRIIGRFEKVEPAKKADKSALSQDEVQRSVKAANLINAYRTYGHLGVMLDPLGINKPKYHAELDYKAHGLKDEDLDKTVHLGGEFGVEIAPLRDLMHYLKSTYSARVGAEFMHIESSEERAWIQRKLEATAGTVSITTEEKLKALQDILEAESFENFAHVKFPGTKRFSVEGGENLISSINVVFRESVAHGVKEFILGMAHRGRLNTLTKIMGKPYHAMFSEFKGGLAYPDNMGIPGDVKYHLGTSSDLKIDGVDVHLSLTPNPSHLEVVNAVVLGKVRAKQDQRKDITRSQVLGILIHGDAAFAGQGSVMEALSLSQLDAYHTGGTVHIVANNQIGFTTNTVDSRSTNYCTDIAKFINVPIFHVNGDDAEAVVYVSKMASEFRAKFKKDVVIDLVCYRKYGHNEGDEPFFTQPMMYSVIKNKSTPDEVFASKLVTDGVIAEGEFASRKAKFKDFLESEFVKSQTFKPKKADWLEAHWSKFEQAKIDREEIKTGVALKKLKEVGKALSQIPGDFNINPKIARQLELKKQMIDTGKDLDWSMAEALAYGSMLQNGYKIRMTGQDVERGTFSHRHAVLIDQANEQKYIPLNNIAKDKQANLEIHNSNLSEFGVLGFEYGYSFTDPMTLTIWEAQFGDFANGAQVIIDQYVISGEAKWLRMSGLVMLLPHGYEGQGPEHSSARLERFLQLGAKDNIQVVSCTTPASFFHVLRRQMLRNFRKPLIVMSPKSLLRHKLVISNLEEMAEGTSFKPVLPETDRLVANDKVKKVILCSGKVYYDLYEKRNELKINDIAIIRLEQLYPFPASPLAHELAKYKNAEVLWCQEEHENMGGYYHLYHRIDKVLKSIKHSCTQLKYVGRDRSASPAVGYMKLHTEELEKLLKEAFK